MTNRRAAISKISGIATKFLLRVLHRQENVSGQRDMSGAEKAVGATLGRKRVLEEDRMRLEKLLRTKADDTSTLNELGQVLMELGLHADAENLFRQVLQIDPDFNAARSNLGQALRLLGNLDEAELILRAAARANPADPVIYNRLATVLSQRGMTGEAEHYYTEALRLQPGNVDILNNLGSIASEQGKWAEAEQWFRNAIAVEPGHAIAACNLGLALAGRGMRDEAEKHFLAAMDADPSYFYARVTYVMNKLAIIHDDVAGIERSREAYRRALQELRDWLPLDQSAFVRAAAETVGWVTPFYLAYQGKNDRELQAAYGEFLCQIMARRYPEYTQPPAKRSAQDGRPLRIGVASAFFADHSNWRTPIQGWIENIDRTGFQVFGYHAGFTNDENTEAARRACHQFVEGLPFEALARKIRDDALDVLIYPGIGLDHVTTKLAALRLAPVQCNSWGHPDTSGMPTIDYFLSSELMEPVDGQQHYTEKLVRLPNLSIHYTPPRNEIPPLSRKDFGLDESRILYCCAQSLFKYLPQFDFIFPGIAREVPNSQFLFFSSQKSADLTAKFIQRVHHAFELAGLDASRHVMMMSRMDNATFQAATRICDIYLDSLEWSGCNTTLEAVACNLPTITVGGSMMRGRHTYAFLKMMGFDELIADSPEDYIALAVKLGRDESLRRNIRTKIPARLHRLYGDLTCVRALEDFFRDAVKSSD